MQLREKNVFKIDELNTLRQGSHSKNDRIERLEPDFRLGRFLVPGLIYNPERGGRCTWVVWDETRQKLRRRERRAGAPDRQHRLYVCR